MRLSRQNKENILADAGRCCQCMDDSHTSHPNGDVPCGRPLKVRYYFKPTKSMPLNEDDFIVICSSCNSENRSLRSQKY